MLKEFASAISKGLIDKSLTTCSRWAEHRIVMPVPYPGPINWEKFPWEPEILNCWEDFVSVQKACQMGFTEIAMMKALYQIFEKGENVLYILPRGSEIGDFTKGRLDSMIDEGPDLRTRLIESNVGFKKTDANSHLYIRGSISERNLVSVPVGVGIIDEFDRCSKDAMALVWKRFSAREQKHLFALSTPTLPEHGINEQFKKGTQEHFMFKCPGCGKRTELIWPECVEICGESSQDPDCARSYYKCQECGVELPHELKTEWLATGRWEKTQNSYGHRSFWIPGMYSPGMSAEDVVREHFQGEVDERKRIQFFNQTLGLPYIMEGGRITLELLNNVIGNHKKTDSPPPDWSRMITMGVDVGSFLDIVITEYIWTDDPGNEPHLNSFAKVLWEGRLPRGDYQGLDFLMEQWQVQHCCIDPDPEPTAAEQFAKRFRGHVSLVRYRTGTSGSEIKLKEDENGVPNLVVDRTSFLDMSLGRVHKRRISLPMDISEVFKEHLQSLTRTMELDSLGNPRAVYVTNKADHMAHALLYCEVALFRAYNHQTGRSIKAGESWVSF